MKRLIYLFDQITGIIINASENERPIPMRMHDSE